MGNLGKKITIILSQMIVLGVLNIALKGTVTLFIILGEITYFVKPACT